MRARPWETTAVRIPGRLPERPKGAVCKTVGNAFVGSNPTPATTSDTRKSASDLEWCPRVVSSLDLRAAADFSLTVLPSWQQKDGHERNRPEGEACDRPACDEPSASLRGPATAQSEQREQEIDLGWPDAGHTETIAVRGGSR